MIDYESTERVGTITNERKVIDQALLSGEIELASIQREKDRILGRLRTVRKYRKLEDLFSVALRSATEKRSSNLRYFLTVRSLPRIRSFSR